MGVGTLVLSLCLFNEVHGLAINQGKADHDGGSFVQSTVSAQKSILSSSVQDYLTQIAQMQTFADPPVAIPGEWLTDAKRSFVFLPIKFPTNLPLDDVKVLTDGKSLLVNVVERPMPHPEDEATKKFRLVLDAFKEETKGNDLALVRKLQEWLADEDSVQVQSLIRETLTAINKEEPRTKQAPRSLTIPLNELQFTDLRRDIVASHMQKKAIKKATDMIRVSNPHGGTATIRLKSTYLQEDATTKNAQPGSDPFGGLGGSSDPNLITIPLNAQLLQELVKRADYVVPLNTDDAEAFADLKGSSLAIDGGQQKTYIKESFSIALPYASEISRVFSVLQGKGRMIVCIPFEKDAPRGRTIPFSRVPLFDMDGNKLLGPGARSAEVTPEVGSTEKVEKKPQAVVAVKKSPTKMEKSKPQHLAKQLPSNKPAAPVAHKTRKLPPVPPAPPSAPARELIPIGGF